MNLQDKVQLLQCSNRDYFLVLNRVHKKKIRAHNYFLLSYIFYLQRDKGYFEIDEAKRHLATAEAKINSWVVYKRVQTLRRLGYVDKVSRGRYGVTSLAIMLLKEIEKERLQLLHDADKEDK